MKETIENIWVDRQAVLSTDHKLVRMEYMCNNFKERKVKEYMKINIKMLTELKIQRTIQKELNNNMKNENGISWEITQEK